MYLKKLKSDHWRWIALAMLGVAAALKEIVELLKFL
jgi:hypothetical protein